MYNIFKILQLQHLKHPQRVQHQHGYNTVIGGDADGVERRQTHPLVVVLDLGCHADLHHEGRVLLAVLSQDELPVLPRQVLGRPHEEHVPAPRRLALLLPHLYTHKQRYTHTHITHTHTVMVVLAVVAL